MSTCYFKKHIAAFIFNYGHTTPLQLNNSVDISLTVSQQHEMWLQKVFVTESSMRKIMYPHIHLYGTTGLDQAGFIKCGKGPHIKMFTLPCQSQNKVDRRKIVITIP